MILKILGSGTSTGVPVPACKCAVCTSTDPRNQRLRTSALVTTADGRSVLIDSSPDLRQQALRYGIERVDAVLYTHEHADHIAGIDDLRGFCFRTKTAIPCFASRSTISDLLRRYDYIFNPDPSYKGMLPQLELREISEGAPFEAAGASVLPFELRHGSKAATGFRIGSLAYATDCNDIPPRAKEILRGVDTLIITGLRYDPHPSHFTIPQAIEAAAAIGPRRTILIHMTHTIDHAEVSKKLPAGVELAYDGMEIPIQA